MLGLGILGCSSPVSCYISFSKIPCTYKKISRQNSSPNLLYREIWKWKWFSLSLRASIRFSVFTYMNQTLCSRHKLDKAIIVTIPYRDNGSNRRNCIPRGRVEQFCLPIMDGIRAYKKHYKLNNIHQRFL